MLELSNFGHISTSTVDFETLDRSYRIITFNSKTFILRMPRVTNSADFIKIAVILNKTVKRSKNQKN